MEILLLINEKYNESNKTTLKKILNLNINNFFLYFCL